MPLLIPAGYGHVIIPIRLTGLDRRAAITFGVEQNEVGFPSTAWANTIQACFTDNFSLDTSVQVGPTVLRVNLDGTEPVTVEGSVTHTGVWAGNMLPPNVALLLRKSSLRGGRRGRGRMYVPWALDEANVAENGQIDSATITTMQTRANDFLTDLDTAGWPMHLLHSSGGSTAPGSPNPVTALTVDPAVATQRRRLRG